MDTSSESIAFAVAVLAAPLVFLGGAALVGWWIASGDAALGRRRRRRTGFGLAGFVAAVLVVGVVGLVVDVSGGDKPSPLFIETSPGLRLVLDLIALTGWLVLAAGLAGGFYVVVLVVAAAFDSRPLSPNVRAMVRLLGRAAAAAMLLVWVQALYLDGGTLISALMGRGLEVGDLGPDFFVSTLLEVAALAASVIVVGFGHRHPTARVVGPWLLVAALVVAELALLAGVVGGFAGTMLTGWVVRLALWSAAAWMYGLTRIVLRRPLVEQAWAPPLTGPAPMPRRPTVPPAPGPPARPVDPTSAAVPRPG